MRSLAIIALAAAFALPGCKGPASEAETGEASSTTAASPAQPPAPVVRDGSSIERAVVIKAPNGFAGVGAEYRWLDEHYPGYRRGKQALITAGDKPYDVIEITTADGRDLTIYFDISDFYGKW